MESSTRREAKEIILSSHQTLFQASSDEICRLFNKTITLPSVLLSLVFDLYFIFCKYPFLPDSSVSSICSLQLPLMLVHPILIQTRTG